MIPDGGDGYRIANVYGMCESAWRYGGVRRLSRKRADKKTPSDCSESSWTEFLNQEIAQNAFSYISKQNDLP